MQYNDNSVPSKDRKSLLHIIHHVIGIDKFTDNLNSLTKSEVFTRAQEHHLVWCCSVVGDLWIMSPSPIT